MAFIRMLRHVRLAVLRTIAMPSVIASNVVHLLRSSLFIFAWMFTYSLAYLIVLLTLLLMVVKNLKPFLTLFSKDRIFFDVRTDFLHQYHFPVSCYSIIDISRVFIGRAFTWYVNTCRMIAWHVTT